MRIADVIIPVYKPNQKLFDLIGMLEKQGEQLNKIILVNTAEIYFESLMQTSEDRKSAARLLTLQNQGKIVLRHISKEDFDHGKTRNLGVSLSDSPFFIMMTDDAVPADEKLISRLLSPFDDVSVAVSYGRQLPAEGCGIIESYTRSFNYPDESALKSAADLEGMGIKAFFASNVCAAYRRDIFDRLGGFTNHTIFNEDMIYARGVLNAGFKIAYVADAMVKHSHNYSGAEQFRRNFDLGVSHASYPEVFGNLKTESEGIRLVKKTSVYLLKEGKAWLIFKLFWQSGCKYMGYLLGKRYRELPLGMQKRCSMNPGYWKENR